MNTPSCTSSSLPPPPLHAFLLVRIINHRGRYLPLPFRKKQDPGLCVWICVSPPCPFLLLLPRNEWALLAYCDMLAMPREHLPRIPWLLFDVTSQIIIFPLIHWRMVFFQATLSSSKEQQRLLWNWWKKWQTTAKVRASRMLWCATCTRRA